MNASASIADLIVETPGTCGGRPRVAGRRITVEHIAVWHERTGMSADEICSEHGLTLGQVHAALSYHVENRQDIDRLLEEGDAVIEAMRSRNVSPVREKLEHSRSA